jgi:hemoglobin
MRTRERLRRTELLAGLLALALVRPVPAGEAPAVELGALDRQIFDALKEVHNRGADLHNAGDPVSCYRIFQGMLLTAKPLLGHHPEVQQAIEKGLAEAEQKPSISQRAMTLHLTIEGVRNALKPAGPALPKSPAAAQPTAATRPFPAAAPPPLPTATAGKAVPLPSSPGLVAGPREAGNPVTLWRRLGGQARVEKVVDDFVESVKADPRVNLSRGGKHPLDDEALAALKRKFVGYVSSVSEGTVPYTGRPLAEAHAGMGVTVEEFSAMAAALRLALEKNGVAAADVDALMQKVAETRKEVVAGP